MTSRGGTTSCSPDLSRSQRRLTLTLTWMMVMVMVMVMVSPASNDPPPA